MNVIKNFKELKKAKDKKEGVLTPELLLEDALENVENIQEIAIVVRTKDGYTMVGSCTEDSMITVGLLEAGKFEYMLNIGVEE